MKLIKFVDTESETIWFVTDNLDRAINFMRYLLKNVSHPETFVIWEPETGKAAKLLDMAAHYGITL